MFSNYAEKKKKLKEDELLVGKVNKEEKKKVETSFSWEKN